MISSMLRAAGWPEEIVRAIQSHADHTGVARETALEHHLFACDELSGFVVAVARVRPGGFEGLAPKSVTKKLKTPAFAAGVSREDVRQGADEIGLELAEHITNVIAAVLLFLFGQGPVKGFAVVLVIGVITSVFTAVTITRMWVAGWLRKARPADLHI